VRVRRCSLWDLCSGVDGHYQVTGPINKAQFKEANAALILCPDHPSAASTVNGSPEQKKTRSRLDGNSRAPPPNGVSTTRLIWVFTDNKQLCHSGESESRRRTRGRVHVHFDAEALDPEIVPANSYAAPGGLQPHEAIALITELSALRPVVSATVASWDPAFDEEVRLARALMDVIESIALVMDRS